MDYPSPSMNHFASSGGFNPSGGIPNASHSSSSSSSSSFKKRDMQSVTAVTVRQVLSGNLGEKVLIEGNLLELVGHLSNAQPRMSNSIEFQFHDLTGSMPLKSFQLTGESDELGDLKRKELEELGQYKYVRIYGNWRALNEDKVFMVQAIRPITDMNAVTYHLLSVLHTYLKNTKPPLTSYNSTTQRQGNNSNSFAVPAGAPHSSAMDSSINYSHGNNSVDSFNALQQDVLNAVSAGTHDDTGCNVNDIIRRLQSRFSIADIQQQISYLTDEGHLFTTIDEHHVKLTSNS